MNFGHLSFLISNKVFLRFNTATTLYTICNTIILISRIVLQYGNGCPVKGLIDLDKPCKHWPWPLTVISQSGDHQRKPCKQKHYSSHSTGSAGHRDKPRSDLCLWPHLTASICSRVLLFPGHSWAVSLNANLKAAVALFSYMSQKQSHTKVARTLNSVLTISKYSLRCHSGPPLQTHGFQSVHLKSYI